MKMCKALAVSLLMGDENYQMPLVTRKKLSS